MTIKKLKQTSHETGRLPATSVPRAGVRGRSAEGFVGRPAGLQPQPPKFGQEDLERAAEEA
jgi:hypothetical protein